MAFFTNGVYQIFVHGVPCLVKVYKLAGWLIFIPFVAFIIFLEVSIMKFLSIFIDSGFGDGFVFAAVRTVPEYSFLRWLL